MKSLYIFLITLFSIWVSRCCDARVFTLEMHHRFSEPVKKWWEATGNYFPAGNWPEKGSIEYYAQLAHHDRIRRGRRMSESDSSVTFSEGNSTFRISSLGL